MSNAPLKPSTTFFARLLHAHVDMEARLKELERAADGLTREGEGNAALSEAAALVDQIAAVGKRHHDDEAHTLFPRLRPLPEFKQLLDAFDFQHQMNDTEEKARMARLRSDAPGSGLELRKLVYRYTEMHRAHMLSEERVLFTAAEQSLSRAILEELEGELRGPALTDQPRSIA